MTFCLALAGPWGPATWVDHQSQKLYPKSKPSDLSEYNDALRKNLRKPARMASTDHRSSEARLDKVMSPVLVVMECVDPDFSSPEEEGKLVSRRLHGELALLPGVGHYPQAEQPEAFLNPVFKFLRGIQQRQ